MATGSSCMVGGCSLLGFGREAQCEPDALTEREVPGCDDRYGDLFIGVTVKEGER
jgi:hypothetical protein